MIKISALYVNYIFVNYTKQTYLAIFLINVTVKKYRRDQFFQIVMNKVFCEKLTA